MVIGVMARVPDAFIYLLLVGHLSLLKLSIVRPLSCVLCPFAVPYM